MPYTTIDDPSAYFQTALYTGTGSSLSITNNGNSDLQPDWVWIKERNGLQDHALYDSSRGVQEQLESNTDTAETTESTGLTAFGSDGFTVGALAQVNTSSDTYVAWQWKANGGTTSSNTDGTITSTVQANTDAGFSIVTYTTGSVVAGSGGWFSVGHGLGVTPDMVITKRLSNTSSWWTWHTSLTNDTTRYVALNSTAAEGNVGDMWGNGHTSSVFGGGAGSHYSTSDYVAYCFASKQGYSKFGKYTGNGNADGPFVYLGFKPAFLITKRTDATEFWAVWDSSRDTHNVTRKRLAPNDTQVEADSTFTYVDFLSNGFKPRTTGSRINQNGGSYIYMAFAENPFVTSTGIPTTAR